MIHKFDTKAAKLCGVNAAILLEYLSFCCEKNKKAGRNFHEGHT